MGLHLELRSVREVQQPRRRVVVLDDQGEKSLPSRPLDRIRVDRDGQWYDNDMRLRVDSPLTALRLDPAQAARQIGIALIRLSDGHGTTIREWHFD